MKLAIAHAARETPHQACLVTPERTLSYAEVSERVGDSIEWLRSIGVEPSAAHASSPFPVPFPITARPDLQSVSVLLALFELGVPALLLHPRWTELERTRVLEATGLDEHAVPDSFESFPAVRVRSSVRSPLPVDPERPLAIVHTSGSSGAPKGVVLSRRAFLASAQASAEVMGWLPPDRWLLGLPLAHVGGLSILTRCLIARQAVVLPEVTAPGSRFDPAAILQSIERTSATLLSLVPAQLTALLESAPRCPPTVRWVLLGGAGAPPSLLERARTAGWPVHCTYGLTETCSQVTLQRTPFSSPDLGGSGEPLPGVELRIEDSRIEIRSPTLLSGYFPPAEPALDAAGWFATADCGEWVDGELRVWGRADEVIITGGENVHPLEIERQLLEHPGIRAVCVFGLPDARWGQIVAATVVPEPGNSLDDLASWCESRLATFKRPRRVVLVDALPTTSSGKIQRHRARELFQEAQRTMRSATFKSSARITGR